MDFVHRKNNVGILFALLQSCVGVPVGPLVDGVGECLVDPLGHVLYGVGLAGTQRAQQTDDQALYIL